MSLAVAGSDHGNMTFFLRTGRVHRKWWYYGESESPSEIPVKLDVKEYKAYYPTAPLTRNRYLDLKDIGYWTAGGAYVPPSREYRIMIKRLQKTGRTGRAP